jgi:hypothetical protein
MLGAPLSVDWGTIYSPRTAGGVMHSGVIQESAFGQAWDKDIADLGGGIGFSGHYGNHGVGEATSVDTYADGKRMVSTIRSGVRENVPVSDQTAWVRTVSMVTADPKLPILLIRDTFSGKGATEPKIWSMNLMAEGAVDTPAGVQTPPLRTHPRDSMTDAKTQMPSAGSLFSLNAAVNRLAFSGQTWKGHPSNGIDWDMYLLPQEEQQAHIGNWANTSSPSGHEFEQAQDRKFEERQHILRVRGTGAFTTLIVPWNKGAKPQGVSVKRVGADVVVTTPGQTITFKPDGSWMRQ